MVLLILFALLAGVVTILSPCILPMLPIILSSSVDSTGKKRPLGVVTGFVLSFTLFTLFLSTIVNITKISPDLLRDVSILVLIGFGLSLVVPQVQLATERLFSQLTRLAPGGQNKKGFFGGVIVGLSLGLLWTPCVGPILASVISLAISGTVTAQAAVITLAYAVGTAIPMFIVLQSGASAMQKVPGLLRNSGKIQKGFGVLMIVTAIGIFFNVDRRFQTYILTTFPNYGVGLTKIEDNPLVRQALGKISSNPVSLLPEAPEIIAGGEWFNSAPLTIKSLKGKVVLVDFWTYSCINCQRTFPYLRNWWAKYKDSGLVIIGVHSPEFEFEKTPNNVAAAVKDFQLTYPVVQDNDLATWKAYQNLYWPADYLIDRDGHIRDTHFGEGGYDETEKEIQDLLKETGAVNVPTTINNPTYQVDAQTPETYLGVDRIQNLASPEDLAPDGSGSYSFPDNLGSNQVAFQGNWIETPEFANPQQGAQLEMDFNARDVYLVMSPKAGTAQVRVFVDDKMQYFGEDDKNGIVTVDADRLYKLINLPSPGQHRLRLEFLDSNADLYAFTFG